MDFSQALLEVKKGRKVRRKEWIDKSLFIHVNLCDFGSHNAKISKHINGFDHTWFPSSFELLQDDWELVV